MFFYGPQDSAYAHEATGVAYFLASMPWLWS